MTEPMRFDGEVAVVTGAGRGIGRAYAVLLAERGAHVVVNDLGAAVDGTGHDAGPADEVVAEIAAAGGSAIADSHSVATKDGAEALVDLALERFGRVDVVVHNAGYNLGTLDEMLDIHVRAGWWLTDRAWDSMVGRGAGRIVLTTSSAGSFGDGTGPGFNPKQAYSTAKSAIIGLTRSLAVRGSSAGISSNAVSPSAYTRLVGLNRGIQNPRPGAPPPDAAIDWSQKNSPASLVAAGALWLMHRSCPVSGRIYNIGGGRVSEVFVGVSRGYIAPAEGFQPEDVVDHLDEIGSRDRYNVPSDLTAHGQWVRAAMQEARG